METHPFCQSAHIKALTAHLSFQIGDDDQEEDDEEEEYSS